MANECFTIDSADIHSSQWSLTFLKGYFKNKVGCPLTNSNSVHKRDVSEDLLHIHMSNHLFMGYR